MWDANGYVFEPFWPEIGYVLYSLTWNLVWLLDKTIFLPLTSGNLKPFKNVYANGTHSWVAEIMPLDTCTNFIGLGFNVLGYQFLGQV